MKRTPQIIKVRDVPVTTQEVLEILIGLKEKQEEIKGTKKVYFSRLSYYHALKYNIFFKNLLLHPLVLKKKWFSEEKRCLKTKKEIRELLQAVIEYELTTNEQTNLSTEERTSVIAVFRFLEMKTLKESSTETTT